MGNAQKKKMLFVEHLDLTSYLYCLFMKERVSHIYFVSISRVFIKFGWLLKPLEGNLLRKTTDDIDKESYYTITKYALFVAEKLFDSEVSFSIRNLAHKYAKKIFKLNVKDFTKLDLYLKKLLYINMIEKVKTYYFLLGLKDSLGASLSIIFLPNDDLRFLKYMSRYEEYAPKLVTKETVEGFIKSELRNVDADFNIPAIWSAVLSIKNILLKLYALIYYSLAITVFILKRIARPTIEKKPVKYAIHWNNPIIWHPLRPNRIHHFYFFYDHLDEASDYNFKNILFVFDRGELTKEDFAKLGKNGYSYIDLRSKYRIDYRLATSMLLSLPTIAFSVLMRIVLSWKARPLAFYGFMKLIFMTLIVEYEAGMLDCKYYGDMSEYAPEHILKTLIFNKYGIKTYGLCHGDSHVHIETTCYLYMNLFLVWSQRHKDFFSYVWQHIDKIEIIGPFKNDFYRLPLAQKNAVALAKSNNHFKISIFDTSFHQNTLAEGDILKSYEDIFDILERIEGVYIVVKSKLYVTGRVFEKRKFQKIAERIAGMNNVFVMDSWYPSQEAFKFSDLVIAFGTCSAGIEALCCGKKVLFYDLLNIGRHHPFRKYAGLVYDDKDKLSQRILSLKNGGRYMDDEELQKIINYEGKVRQSYARFFVEEINKV